MKSLTQSYSTAFVRRQLALKFKQGFTLLEVVLALSLSVIVMSMVVTAIRMFMLQLEQRQKEIEQKHIARGVVRMIGDDLRAAIQYKAEDYAGLENLIASQSLAGLGAAAGDLDSSNLDADQLEQDILDAVAGGGTDGAGVVGSEEENAETSEEEPEVEEELGRPTLVGGTNFIRLDTSRLPRLHEYNPIIATQGSEDHLPSDVKSVTYYFSNSAPTSTSSHNQEFGRKGGLYRRQIDRAFEAYQSDEDDIEIVLQPDEYSDLVAAEIAALQFRFWDGEQWMAEWDSGEQMGFPSAVEIQVVIDPERISQESTNDEVRELAVEVIRTVIHLPVAEIIPEEEESDSEEVPQ